MFPSKTFATSLALTAASVVGWGLFAYLLSFDRKVRRNAQPGRRLDHQLNDRIRHALDTSGVVSNPGGIIVRSTNGYVTLSGDVFWSEIDEVMTLVRALPGVKGARNSLSAHQSADGVPSLQGRPFPANQNMPRSI